MTNKASVSGIDPTAVPSGNGCVECLQAGDWWLHLRIDAQNAGTSAVAIILPASMRPLTITRRHIQ